MWTDEDNRAFLARHYDWFLPVYDAYSHHIERVDAVRYFILLHYGGVYLDLDMECRKPLDPLLEHLDRPAFGMLALPTTEHATIGNAFMAAPCEHPFFRFATRSLSRVIERDISHADVVNNTGPGFVARMIEAWRPLGECRIFGLDICCDAGALERSGAAGPDPERLYLIHHHRNSWFLTHPPPPEPSGFRLLTGYDIPGCNVGYVEYAPGDYETIVQACRDHPQAVAFNFNGYLKGAGAQPQRVETAARGGAGEPWVCIQTGRTK